MKEERMNGSKKEGREEEINERRKAERIEEGGKK